MCLLVLVASACSDPGSDAPREGPARPATSTPLGTSTRATSTAVDVDAFVADLAAAGIGVYAAGSTTPMVPVNDPGPFTLTDDEAAAAALGASAHSGLAGATVDQLVQTPPLVEGTQPIPASLLIGAWSQVAPGPRAALAKKILGKQDWTKYGQVVFPAAVLGLFAADVAATGSNGGGPGAVNAVQGTSACEVFKNAIFGIIDKVFAAIGRFEIKTFTGNVFTDILTFIRNIGALLGNAVLDGARIVLVTGIETALGPILSGVATVATIAAVATKIMLALQPWSAFLSPSPPVPQRDTAAHPGSLTLTMTGVTGQTDWPDEIAGCARAVNVELPSLKPTGGQLRWTVVNQQPAPMIEVKSQPSTLDQNGQATLTFETLPESPEVAAGENQTNAAAYVLIHVHRTDLDKLHELLSQEAISLLPAIARTTFRRAILDLAEPQLKKLLAPIAQLRDQRFLATIPVNYHTPDHTPTPTPSRRKLVIPTGCPSAAVTSFGYTSAGSQVVDGVLSCWYSRDKVLLGVAIVKQKAKKSICPHAKPIDIPGAEAAWIDNDSSCGTPSSTSSSATAPCG